MQTPTLRTPRLILRPLRADDADAIAAGVGNYDVVRWLSSVPYPYGADDAVRFIAAQGTADSHVWAICDISGLSGIVSIGEELGYWLSRGVWGRGYLTEAATAAIDWWFGEGAATTLHASHYDDNLASRHVLDKLGFAVHGPCLRRSRALNQDVVSTRMTLHRGLWTTRRSVGAAAPLEAVR